MMKVYFVTSQKNIADERPNEKVGFGIADCSYTFSKVILNLISDGSVATLLPIVEKVCRPEVL
jgi:hypothetical protein